MATTHPVFAAWPETFRLFRTQRILFVPLGISAGVKTTLLGLSLFAPFAPFSGFMAPFVRYFWGELYLHYPYHLALASRWFRRTDLVLPILLEGLLMGITALLARQLMVNHSPKLRYAFAEAFRRYPAIAILTVIDVVALIFLIQLAILPTRILLQKIPALTQNPFGVAFIIAFIVTVVSSAFDTLFLFAIPSCVIENRPWAGSLWHSFRMAVKSYRWIFLTVLAVTLCYLPVLVVRYGSVGLVESAWPESIFLMYLIRILFSWVLGTLLTVWATVYLTQQSVPVPKVGPK